MFSALFEWLDRHPAAYWCVAVPVTGLVLSRAWGAGSSAADPAANRRALAGDALALVGLLFAWRWPFLFWSGDFNLDESQLIAGAITLTHDPVFWRSVDGTTSGPLNFYALLPFRLVGLPLDYFTARVAGLSMIGGALCAVYVALARNFGRRAAWLGILPAAVFFATVTHPDFVHYSSEHVTILLVGVSIWLLGAPDPGTRRVLIACVLAGAAPWAKLQAAPLSVAIVLWAMWRLLGSGRTRNPGVPAVTWRATGAAVLAALAPTVVVATLVIATGQTESALQRYFFQNIHYIGESVGAREVLRQAWSLLGEERRFLVLLASSAVVLVAGMLASRKQAAQPGSSQCLFAGLLLTAAAVVAIVAPQRSFLHYALLLPIPLSVLLGVAASRLVRRGVHPSGFRDAGAWVVPGVVLLAIAFRCADTVPVVFGNFAEHWRKPRSTTGEVIHASVAGPDATLAVWGWAPRLYVEANLPQATRDPLTLRSIQPGPLQAYFRRDFIADFRRNQPDVFVDVVGPNAFMFTSREAQGHELFPELGEEVRRNYSLLLDHADGRIYVRNGSPRIRRLTASQIAAALDAGRSLSEAPHIAATLTDSSRLDWRTLGSARVLMLQTPARVEWEVPRDARRVVLEFGMHPDSYTVGTTNGAEIVVEVVGENFTVTVFRRLLRPREKPGDRGVHRVAIPIPPIGVAQRLVIRSDPGEHGDTAWDWAYLQRVQLEQNERFHPSQFPGFSRVPVAVEGVRSELVGQGAEVTLEVHPTAAFLFQLRPTDREVSFDFGLYPASYAAAGQTDGATFLVEILRESAPQPIVVFKRHLDPFATAADRGTQSASMTLPEIQPNDVLKLTLHPGPDYNASWDWTYLRNFRIR
jgi:hypothetical protein